MILKERKGKRRWWKEVWNCSTDEVDRLKPGAEGQDTQAEGLYYSSKAGDYHLVDSLWI